MRARGGPDDCSVHSDFDVPGSLLDYNRMFQRLYAIYDRRFVYNAPALKSRTERGMWDKESPLLADTVWRDEAFAEMEPPRGLN